MALTFPSHAFPAALRVAMAADAERCRRLGFLDATGRTDTRGASVGEA